jgi:carbon monoxide dehydrogenase subunit G
MDVPRVIPCMPGAELVDTVDENAWKARMRVKLGPISLSFLTDVRRDEADEAARRVRLAADAREERGRGAAMATIDSSLVEAEGRTRVETATDLTLTGPAAQYGRPGLIQDVASQLLKRFAECLEQQLTPAVAAAEKGAPAPPPSAPPEQRPVQGLSLGLRALVNALGRLVRRLTRRS